MKLNKKGDAGVSSILGVFLLLTAFGGYMEYDGKWGQYGKYAIKNCVGTHINGNCSHLRIDSLGTRGVNTNNFGPNSGMLEDIID